MVQGIQVQDRAMRRDATSYDRGMSKPYFVRAEWDDESGVWVASSDDVPGLVTEAETLEGLNDKLRTLVPELLEVNGVPTESPVTVELLARRFSVASTAV